MRLIQATFVELCRSMTTKILRKLILALPAFLCVLFQLASSAEAQPSRVHLCDPAALDIYALPPAESTPRPTGHLLVLEIQNIGVVPCILGNEKLTLLPSENGQTSDGEISSHPPIALEPMEWAHVLIAWISERVLGQECQQHWGISIQLEDRYLGSSSDSPVTLDLRNVAIQSCRGVHISGYRKGHYTRDSVIDKEMLQYSTAPSGGWYSIPSQVPWSEVQQDVPQYQISSNFPRIMLGAEIELRFVSPPEADNGCSFHTMRMRELSGKTVLSFQDCSVPAVRSPMNNFELSGALMSSEFPGSDNMLPGRTGPVDYDFVLNLGTTASPHWNRARIQLPVRDPKTPEHAAILDPLPDCTTVQLRLSALPPAMDDAKKFVRAYEATNTSAQSCSLACIPDLDLYDPEFACPNCGNDLFGIRPNGRVDLKPGSTAHFLVGTKSIDRDFDFSDCKRVATMHFKLPGQTGPSSPEAAPIELPYGGCVSPYEVSA